jgi:hypothetical protein
MSFARTVESLRAMGKMVVVVAPPPKTGVDLGLCVERLQSGLPSLGVPADCSIDVSAYRASRKDVIGLLQRITATAQVNVIWPGDEFCRGSRCKTVDGGTPIYRDAGHFSYEGSIRVGRSMELLTRVVTAAR